MTDNKEQFPLVVSIISFIISQLSLYPLFGFSLVLPSLIGLTTVFGSSFLIPSILFMLWTLLKSGYMALFSYIMGMVGMLLVMHHKSIHALINKVFNFVPINFTYVLDLEEFVKTIPYVDVVQDYINKYYQLLLTGENTLLELMDNHILFSSNNKNSISTNNESLQQNVPPEVNEMIDQFGKMMEQMSEQMNEPIQPLNRSQKRALKKNVKKNN